MKKAFICLCLGIGFNVTAAAVDHSANINCFPTAGRTMFAQTLTAQVSDEERDQIFERLNALYHSEVEARGNVLKIYEFDNMEFGAFAFQKDSEEVEGLTVDHVQIYKGVRFNKDMTADGYAVITCHEIGHHLGGLPFRSWASLEGQADYFSTLKCMRRYFTSLPHNELFASLPPMELVARCQSQFSSSDEVQACARTLEATQSLAHVLKDETGDPNPLATLDNVDPSVVRETDTGHPGSQCRVDTYRSGALCPVSVTEPISYTDYNAGVCNLHRVPDQSRPACWFADPARVSVPLLSSN